MAEERQWAEGEGADVVARYKRIFELRNEGGEEAVNALVKAFNEHGSNLLRHEICYVLGQMKDPVAVGFLCERLKDAAENGMVRHEAAEALGAIGDASALGLLREYAADPVREVAQTCELAVSRIEWSLKAAGKEEELSKNRGYFSVDPAPPPPKDAPLDDLAAALADEKLPMFERYRAMFGLRNKGGDEAVAALCKVLLSDTHSPLLRHELAYVLGQLQNKTAADSLCQVLANQQEHEMVRHEAAEALGCIAPESQKDLLAQYRKDPNHVVSDSCEVALAMYNEDFVYV